MYPMVCPSCGEVINVSRERYNDIKAGIDDGRCQACVFVDRFAGKNDNSDD